VEIRSIKSDALEDAPFGAEIRRSLEYTLNLCESLGFRTKNAAGYAGHAEYGQGEELVGILVHLDVVPEGTGWTYDPFKLTLENGRLYGRGVNDDKGAVIASIYALKAVMDSEIPMNKRFRIIFGCDEESGWECMEHYFAAEEMPDYGFSPDGPFPIVNREKGILRIKLERIFEAVSEETPRIISLNGGQRVNMVPESCSCTIQNVVAEIGDNKKLSVSKGIQDLSYDIKSNNDRLEITTKGKAAHGSEPELGVNAISSMMKILNEIPSIESQQAEFIGFIDSVIGFETEGCSLGIDFEDVESGKLSLNLGIAKISDKRASITLDIRYPVTLDSKIITETIEERVKKGNIKSTVLEDKKPLYVRPDNPLIGKLKVAFEDVTGIDAQLIALKGGTYARAINNGVAFGPIMPGKEDTAHQKNEYLELEDLINSAKIYARAIVELNKN
jgi:succinyl-diaminopimelate desuccinylase